MTPDIYQLFEWFETTDEPNKDNMRFAINSNLMAKKSLLDKLIAGTQNINKFHLYTSGEAYGRQLEYIRDGLNWETWTQNFERICSEANLDGLHMMMTINALCLDTIVEFLDWMLGMKRKYGHNRPGFTCNILRFPSFQSPLTLPDNLRKMYHDEISAWLDGVREREEKDESGNLLVQPWEQDQLSRLIEYLDVVKTPHRNTADKELLEHDFKLFYEQYDARREFNFKETFPRLADWYDDIKIIPLGADEQDIQAPKTHGVTDSLYAKRIVTEDGEVKVVEMKMRGRKTGESDEDYDDELFKFEPDYKPKGGSSIGWNTDTDGLGGAND
jgi:hypothetical protein